MDDGLADPRAVVERRRDHDRRKLGPQRLTAWIQRFGFGKPTGIDFPGESQGIVLPLDKWSGSTIGNVPIGQGIAVTPIQLATAYASIANGGVWVQPHLVKRVGGHARAASCTGASCCRASTRS